MRPRDDVHADEVAYPLRPPPAVAYELAPDVRRGGLPGGAPAAGAGTPPTDEQLERIIARVLAQMQNAP